MLGQAQAAAARIAQDVARLEAADDGQTVVAIWNAIPIELEEPFLDAAEHRAAELGDAPQAERMRAHVAALRQARQQREELERQPPVVRALLSFVYAPDDATARQVFAAQQALLQPYEAQRVADALADQAPDELRERFAARAALLRELRGAAPQPAPVVAPPPPAGLRDDFGGRSFSVQNATIEGDLIQAAGDYIDQTTIHLVQRREWIPPPPPSPPEDAIDRPKRVAEVARLLADAGTVAIGGRLPPRVTVAMQGMAGSGPAWRPSTRPWSPRPPISRRRSGSYGGASIPSWPMTRPTISSRRTCCRPPRACCKRPLSKMRPPGGSTTAT